MLSLTRYAAILARPGLKGMIVASVIGRLPIGMGALAIMLAVQDVSGSFGYAGTITAFYIAGLAVLAPLLGRRIDRSGPRRILTVCAFAYPAALGILLFSLHLKAPLAPALAIAFAAGACFPPITSCMRVFLRQQFGAEDANLSVAFSMDSVLIESIFILGPLLVALFVALLSAQAAVMFAAASAMTGSLLYLRSSALRQWRVEPREMSNLFGPLAEPGFPALLAIALCYALSFGLVEIAVTGYASELQWPPLAGLMLALMSVGSTAGALVYGSRTWRAPLRRQYAATLFLMGLGVAMLGGIDDAWLFAAFCVLSGIAMSPALIIQSMLVSKTSSSRNATEAFTWSATALLTGVSAGIALGGLLLETSPSSTVFVAAGTAAMAAAAFAVILLRHPR